MIDISSEPFSGNLAAQKSASPIAVPVKSPTPNPVINTNSSLDFNNLDPKVTTLAKAIRTTESNNNYDAVGDNGDSHGAYQFNKGNFAHWATQFGLDPNDFSPVNQDKVAYAKIKTWKDEGYHADEIAAMWNGSHLENGRPIANNPQYITKVEKALSSNGGLSGSVPNQANTPGSGLDNFPPLEKSDTNNPSIENPSLGQQAGILAKGAGNFSAGLVKGVGQDIDKAGNFIVGGLGKLTGNKTLQNLAKQNNQQFDTQGEAQKIGSVVGGKVLPAVGAVAAAPVAVDAALGTNIPEALGKGFNASKGLISKLIPKSTAGKVIGGMLLDKAVTSGPVKGLLKILLGL